VAEVKVCAVKKPKHARTSLITLNVLYVNKPLTNKNP